jgi:transposase
MHGRPLKVNWQEDVDTLKQMYLQERQLHRRTHLQALYLLHSGKSIGQVAEVVAVHYDTVQRWLNHYRKGGLAEVDRHLPTNKAGPQPRLDADQQAAVRAASRGGEFRTAADVQAYIAQQFGVRYKLSGSYSLLHRLGLKVKVPRPRAIKADDQAQAAWKKGG